MSWWKSR